MLPILHPGYSYLSRLLQQPRWVDISHFRLVWAPVLWSCCRFGDLQIPKSRTVSLVYEIVYAKSPVFCCVPCGRAEIALSWHGCAYEYLSYGVQSSCALL